MPGVDARRSPGIGQFVYLADANFVPRGETRMHEHREIDVISVVMDGRIAHEGSLEHGRMLEAGDVQVQRAGDEGFSHNEVNPDDSENRMIQLWALPEVPGQPAGYRMYRPQRERVTRIYGGGDDQQDTFPSSTLFEIARLESGQRATFDGSLLGYVASGRASANGETVADGDLFSSTKLDLQAIDDAYVIVVRVPA